MGVIYKLKEEVIAFILDQKRQDPLVTCRGMVNRVRQAFDMDISKSSINNVIKNADLSSAVGRHSEGEKKGQKFTIPQEKKEQILKDTLKAKVGLAPTSSSARAGKKESLPAEKPSPQNAPDTPLDGMGCFFVKAAQWLISEESILGTILENYLSEIPREKLDPLCDVLLYLPAFHMKHPREIASYRNKGLWRLNGMEKKIDLTTANRIYKKINGIRTFSLEMSNHIAPLFGEVSFYQIQSEEGASICLDAAMRTILSDGEEAKESVADQKAITVMSQQLINNLLPAVIQSSSAKGGALSKELNVLVRLFENIKGKEISQISLLDADKNEIAAFSTIPKQKRFFITTVWPWQDGFNALKDACASQEQKTYDDKILKRKLFYSEKKSFSYRYSKEGKTLLGAILLFEEDGQKPSAVILTNITDEKTTSEKILEAYLSRWPYLNPKKYVLREKDSGTNQADHGKKELSLREYISDYAMESAFSEPEDSLGKLFTLFSQYAQRHFFPKQYHDIDVNSMNSIFYNSKGTLKEDGQHIFVTLMLSNEQEWCREDMRYAIGRINESDVLDPKGRRLILRFL